MPPPSWLQSFMANAAEQKYSFIIASLATLAVVTTVIWTSFFSEKESSISLPPSNKTMSIQVTERPEIPNQTEAPPTPTPQGKKIVAPEVTPQQTVQKKQLVIGQGNLYVQVGAFKEPNRARLTFEKMKKQYKRAKIVNTSGLYAVRVGPVITKSDAERLKKHIQRRNNIKGFVVTEK